MANTRSNTPTGHWKIQKYYTGSVSFKAKAMASRLHRDYPDWHHQDLSPGHKVEQPSHCTQLISPTAAERSGTKNYWKIFSFRSLKKILFQTLGFKLKFLLLIFEENNPLWETFFEEIVKGLLKENYYVLNKPKIQCNSASIVFCFVRK